jgi:hypothetical protein
MTFSKHLLRSTLGILAALCLVLFFLVVSYFDRFAGQPYAEIDAFVPVDRVERLAVIVNQLRASYETPSENQISELPRPRPRFWSSLLEQRLDRHEGISYAQACPLRQQDVLAGRLSSQLKLSRKETTRRLALAHDAWSAAGAKGCRSFFVDVDLVMRAGFLRDLNPSLPRAVLKQSLAQLVTERVAWDAKPPCLQMRTFEQKLVYLKGPAGYCLEEGMGLGSQFAFGGASRELMTFLYSRLVVSEAVRDANQNPRSLELTLHPVLQTQLDRYADCLKEPVDCPWLAWPSAGQHQTAVVVVMDPHSQQVLALRCFGECGSSSGLSPLVEEAVAPLLLPAPPASIAKLFYALAFSENSSTTAAQRTELGFQVKTSGQLDGRSLKRNEWWERLALCDLGAKQAGGQTIDCTMARQAQTLASDLGWNQYCATGGNDCGRVRLTGGGSEVMGYAGFFRALPAVASPGRSGSSVLNWSAYNRIRDTGGITQIREPYFAASAAVQSVLGAGDNRVSALGLASLAGQIERMSRGMAPLDPVLIVPSGNRVEKGLTLRQSRQQQAARQVRAAMARVMMGPEPGWDGAGTGHNAFTASFKKSCVEPCPVQAKTGTVSRQDPQFAGTTTFAAIVELDRLARQLANQGDGVSLESESFGAAKRGLPAVLTLGVIAIPRQGQRPLPNGHGASRLGMQLMHDLIVGRS